MLQLSNNVKADDISDFQIEGMSIGDSLLDYFNEDGLIIQKEPWFKSKMYVVGIYKNIEIYDTVDIYLNQVIKIMKLNLLVGLS